MGFTSPSLLTGSAGAVSFSTSADGVPALQADGGGAITIDPGLFTASATTSGAGSFGLYATGTGTIGDTPFASEITTTGFAISTSGMNASAVRADSGGIINLTGGTASTTNTYIGALYATGSESEINASGVGITSSGAGGPTVGTANAVVYDSGATGTISGSTVSTDATANGAIGISVTGGATVTVSDTTVTTNANGAQGLFVSGGGSLTGSGLTITANANKDDVTGFHAGAASNNAFGPYSSGGTLSLTSSTLTTTGTESFGVYTADGGKTTLTSDTITIQGDNAIAGVESAAGGRTRIVGGSITTEGANSIAVYATGSGSRVTTTNLCTPPPAASASALSAVTPASAFDTVTITTTGPNSPGVQADSGGVVKLNGGSVTTTGAGSLGLYATGSGSQISATDVAVSTAGSGLPNANAIYSTAGALVTVVGGSASTAGTDAYVVGATSGGTVNLSGTAITATGDGSGGLGVNGTGSTINGTGLTIATHGDYDSVNNFGPAGFTNQAFPGIPGGGVLNLTSSSIVTTGSNALGGYTADGGVTTLKLDSIATSGLNSAGVTAGAGGTINITGGSYATAGGNAAGVAILDAGTINIAGATVSTTGDGAPGLLINGSGGALNADDVNVTTSGGILPSNGSHADGTYNGPFGGYSGGGTMSITNSTIATSGNGSNGVSTSTGGVTTVTGGSIATSGAEASALLAESGTNVGVQGTTIFASGDGSKGLNVEGSDTRLVATGINVTTTGTIDTETGNHAQGLYNGNGLGESGGPTGGGSAMLTNSAILTKGFDSTGVDTENGGATTLNGGSVTTKGDASYAIIVNSGARTNVIGTAVATTGNGSGGFSVEGAGSTLTASGVTIATQGVLDPVSGQHSYGVYNGPDPLGVFSSGGAATLTNSFITTLGAGMTGVLTGAGGATTLNGTGVVTSGMRAVGISAIDGGVANVNGGSVTTSGQDAHALSVAGRDSQANLSGPTAFSTLGNGAIGVYAALGGVVSATGLTTIATTGGVSPATGLGAYGVNADGAGSQIKLGAATIAVSGPGAIGLFASDARASGSAGAITVSGPLNLQTTNPAAVAVALQGNGASLTATGGGSILAAGDAVQFLAGSGQSASFDNFNIAAPSGDLIFADPAIATVNFSSTVADAGLSNLLDATAGSFVTLNASASTLTGAIRTDATSTSNVNLINGTTWNLTGPSTVTNLNVTHSIIVFAPPGSGGGFRTLTVGNYVGSGANITLNAALGGAGSPSDQIIVNGGSATGATLLTIKNTGGAGGLTSGAGIPVVVATNGGTIAPNAFALSSTPIVNGFKYTLDQSGGDWFLVSSPTSTVADITNSLTNVARAQQGQMVTNRVLTSILLGANQQINCSSCGSGFASFGSLALGAQGRWALSDQLSFIGGASYNQWSSAGINVTDAPTAAGALIYDLTNWGRSRPFFEVGGGLTPYERVNYTRSYANGLSTATGFASATNRSLSAFGRIGWVARLTPIDEAAVYGDLGRSWMQTGGYTEATSPINPFPATVAPGLDTLNVGRIGAQYTHLFNGKIEVNVNGAVAYGFGAGSGSLTDISDFGPITANALSNSTWVEYGGRVGYRVTDRMVVDAFVLGTAGGIVGATIHGGFALRYAF